MIRAAFVMGTMSLLAASMPALAAEPWPVRPVRLIVAFPAGSATDSAARVVGLRMAAELGQAVIIDNRGGASGFIGADAVARGPADGYTLLMGTTSTQAVAVSLNRNLSYAPDKAFAPIGLIGFSPYVIVGAGPAPTPTPARYGSFADFMADARARPGQLTYASAGPTSLANLAAQLLSTSGHVQMTHVPYKSSAQSVTDTITGNVTVQFATVMPVLPFIRNGQLTALAVTGSSRMPLLPDVPTVAESGVPGYEAVLWMGLFARAGTPPDRVDRLREALDAALRDEKVRDALLAQGILQAKPETQAWLVDFLRSEVTKWGLVVKAAGIVGE